jgi:hypothetical protein
MGAPAGPPPGEAPNFMLWLIIAGVSVVMCGNMPFGVIAAILAFLGKQEWEQGKYDTAQSKLKISKIITIITASLMALAILAYIILMVVVGVGAAAVQPTY